MAENIWWNVMVETFGAIAVFVIPEALLIKNIELKQVLTFRKYMVNIWSTTSFESGDKWKCNHGDRPREDRDAR